jgi:hypothetical protein
MVNHFNTYSNKWEQYECYEYYMLHNYPIFRRKKVNQERRRYIKDLQEHKEFGYKIRKRRSFSLLNPWGLLESQISCLGTKSWKKLHKKRKRYL